MKVKIKQINPNPYRDMENYPINREKVEALKASIEQTGFWDNILVRPKPGHTTFTSDEMLVEILESGGDHELDYGPSYLVGPDCNDFESGNPVFNSIKEGEYITVTAKVGDDKQHLPPMVELAYGHHRLTALKELLNPDDYIDIPVKELDDSTMIKIMANENMDEWKASPKVIDETVRVTKQYLEEHPEETLIYSVEKIRKPQVVNMRIIASFLNWPETRVNYSLQRLGMIEQEVIEKEAIYDLPTDTSARTFAKVVKKHNIPKEEQKKFAEKIKQTESFGESAMDDVWVQDKYTKPQKKQYRDDRILTLETKIAQARNLLDEASDEITDMIRLIKELGAEPFNQSVQGGLFMLTLDRIEKQISQLKTLKLNQNENKSGFGSEDFKRLGE